MPSCFLSCDWGTSHFRLRLVDTASLAVRAEVATDEGVSFVFQKSASATRPELFAGILGRHAAALCGSADAVVPCVISGMASSRIGWCELPYAKAPMPLEPENLPRQTFGVPVLGETMPVTLISGVCTDDDVMRGEECELLGLLDRHPDLGTTRACVILPGTHSKHIHLDGRNLEGFRTCMTGELFAHLRSLPTLQASLAVPGEISENAFRAGVLAAEQLGLSGGLFKIRSRSLLGQDSGFHAPSFLSGLLIGDELLSLKLPSGVPVFLAGSPGLHPWYLRAGEQIGLGLRPISPEILQQSLLHAHEKFLAS